MTTRNYSSRSQQSTLTSAVTAGATTIVVQSGPALLGGATIAGGTTFTLVVDPDTAIEEIVDATAVSTNTFTITRAIDGSSAQAHSAGAVTRHMAIGRDYREANVHIESTTGVHGATGAVVGTTDTQTLTNKTLTAPTITNPSITGAGVDASIVFEGATADAHETTLTVVDPTQDNTITLPNTTGTVVLATATQTLTNKTMGDALNAGGFKITNLATPTDASDAVRKDFADSQVAAAATSAASASTSAASAATSASSALTSANSASASATAAATSAASAATSASTMAASVTAAASSATEAATSATSAASSATAAATSATSASTSASSASTSASSALTSANSASASATAAATSATSAAASATTAANSVATISGFATTASNSASAAATSAASASTSASSALTSATSAATSYDEFDDRYLGSKSTAPTVDNDGNTLLVGAIYWNDVLNNMYVWSGTAWVQIATTSVYTAPTLGTTALTSGTTVSSVSALTLDNGTLTGTLTAASSSGTNGQYLQSTGTGVQWGTVTGYSAPTLGSTSIASGATVTNIDGLTINSTTIPTSATLAKTADKLSVFAATTSSELAGVISDETGSGSLVFGTSPTITPAAGTTTIAAAGAGYMGLPQNSATTGAYTVTATDAGKHIYSTATRTITIDSNANLALPVGTAITFIAGSGATVTVAITTDTMYLAGPGTTGSRTLAAFGIATAVKIASTTWIISGNGLT